MYLSTSRRRRGGLGKLGSQAMPLSLAQAQPNAPNCPWWLWFTGNYLTCTQQPQLVTENNAQIQSVADAAAQYYGVDSPAAIAAQQMANQQMANTPTDVATITTAVENSQVDQSPLTYVGNMLLNPASAPQSLSDIPWYMWVVFGVGGLLLIKALK